MCAPTPESSGSTTSTLAPLVMAVWAMLNCVESLPSAFSTVRSEAGRPAVVKACLRYGASNSTYRVEVVVSGRITVTPPLPAAATDLRPAIALKELLRSLTEIDAAALELLLALADEDEPPAGAELLELLLLLPHAAMSSAAVVAATAVSPALADTEYNGVPRLFSRDMPVTCARPNRVARA